MRFFRYIAVQIAAYLLDMGSFLAALLVIGGAPITANIIGKLVAGTFAYLAHWRFTFGASSQQKHGRQAALYCTLLALNLPLSSGVLSLTLQMIASPWLAKILADVICVFMTYWLSKTFVFSQQNSNAALPQRSHRP